MITSGAFAGDANYDTEPMHIIDGDDAVEEAKENSKGIVESVEEKMSNARISITTRREDRRGEGVFRRLGGGGGNLIGFGEDGGGRCRLLDLEEVGWVSDGVEHFGNVNCLFY